MLAATKEIAVDPDSYDAIAAYLFTIEDALPDYADKASDEQKTGLGEGWEFNSTPVEDPGTRGTVVDGDGNTVVKVMRENGETCMIDGWRMSRWRTFSRVNQETVKNGDGSDAVCLALTAAEVYDNWDGSETGIQNDFANPAAARMDSGKEDPFYARDPSPRDSLYAFHINPGIKRYFAIKMRGTEDCGFGTLNFFNEKRSVLVSADQMTGKKGDVLYWDLLASGFPVGKQLYSAMFFSPTGFTSSDSKILIDWMRFYDSVENIPEESFDDNVLTTGIREVNRYDNTAPEAIYDLNGRKVVNPKAGLYIIKSQNGNRKVVIK